MVGEEVVELHAGLAGRWSENHAYLRAIHWIINTAPETAEARAVPAKFAANGPHHIAIACYFGRSKTRTLCSKVLN